MPIGLLVMRWNDRVGAKIVAKYPNETDLSIKTLMQIYSSHVIVGEAGLLVSLIGAVNVASYYSGPEKGIFIIILFQPDEDVDAFKVGITDIAQIIINNLEQEVYLRLVPSLFQRLAIYPTLNVEQKLAMVYLDKIKRMILNRLREEGIIYKAELSIWLKDAYKGGFIDIERTLETLVKEDLIKITSVKGVPSMIVYLKNDLAIGRTPPINLFKEPSEHGLPAALVGSYRTIVKDFFTNYVPREKDNLEMLKLLLNGPAHETFKLLRETFARRDDLEKLRKKGVDDVEGVIMQLSEAGILTFLRDDQGAEYFGLKSDILVEKFFPVYIIDKIREHYTLKAKTNAALVEYLGILEQSYLSQHE